MVFSAEVQDGVQEGGPQEGVDWQWRSEKFGTHLQGRFTEELLTKLSRRLVARRCQGQRPWVVQHWEGYLARTIPRGYGARAKSVQDGEVLLAKLFVGKGQGKKRRTRQGRHICFSVAGE